MLSLTTVAFISIIFFGLRLFDARLQLQSSGQKSPEMMNKVFKDVTRQTLLVSIATLGGSYIAGMVFPNAGKSGDNGTFVFTSDPDF